MIIICRAWIYSLLVINLTSYQLLILINNNKMSDKQSVYILLIYEYSQ